jgi:signal transduction histidine kinase
MKMSSAVLMDTRLIPRVTERWHRLTLAQQFVIAASVVVCLGMFALGSWVAHKIEEGVVQNTAATTAIYMDSVVEPVLQELDVKTELSQASIDQLKTTLDSSTLGKRIASIKIWDKTGKILFSKDTPLIGKSFPVSDELEKAYAGLISAELNHLTDAENENERKLNKQLVEIYVPMHKLGTDKIIAVAEFYAVADELEADIAEATRQSWMIVLAITLGMLGALFGIVRRGSRTIEVQQIALRDRVEELSTLLLRNEELRLSLSDARRRGADTNERLLRRLGAELHDGPCQLIGLALLRLDGLRRYLPGANSAGEPSSGPDELEMIRAALRDSLEEIRNLSAGIAPPELDGMSAVQAIEIAARNHERRTGTQVMRDVSPLPDIDSQFLKTCIYRFTQEGLNNAFRHANAAGQAVRAFVEDGTLTVEVSDTGPGLPRERKRNGNGNGGLGLAGLRDRVESLGGILCVDSVPGVGTRLRVQFQLENPELAHV